MTNIEASGSGERPRHPWIRVFYGVSVPFFALMACYSLFQFVRGQPDNYPNEHLRSFSLSGALALFMSFELVRSKGARRAVILGSLSFLAVHIYLTYPSAPVNWGTGAAALLTVTGLLICARALWPPRGESREEWDATPATPQQLRAVSVGMALFLLGGAGVLLSLVDVRGASWPVIAMVGAPIALAVVGAVMFLRLRWRTGPSERTDAQRGR